MENNTENTILYNVNGKELSEDEFKKLQESVGTSRGIQLVEIAPNTYKTRIFG